MVTKYTIYEMLHIWSQMWNIEEYCLSSEVFKVRYSQTSVIPRGAVVQRAPAKTNTSFTFDSQQICGSCVSAQIYRAWRQLRISEVKPCAMK